MDEPGQWFASSMTRLTVDGPAEEDSVRGMTVLYGIVLLRSGDDRHKSGSESSGCP